MPAHSNASAATVATPIQRPSKPFDGFPLYAHPLGYWSKKIAGTIVHFGRWGRIQKKKMVALPYEPAWKEALESYRKHESDARSGALDGVVVMRDDDRALPGEVDINRVCNDFYNHKLQLRNAGKLRISSMDSYKSITDLIVAEFGGKTLVKNLTARDFVALRARMAERWGEQKLKDSVTRVRSVFKYAYEIELIPAPIPCLQPHSTIFHPPSQADIRKEKNKHEKEHGKNKLTAVECRKLIANTKIPLKAMILLGLNCGFGNTDCATLHFSAMDLDNGWIEYPRSKTGVWRRCPLWPETVEALREAIAIRPKPALPEYADTVFLRRHGKTWDQREKASAITYAVGTAMKAAKIHRKGLGFYTLRHTFRTEADATLDFPAVRLIMGHTDTNKMDEAYRLDISSERLVAVTNYIRNWLFGTEGGAQ